MGIEDEGSKEWQGRAAKGDVQPHETDGHGPLPTETIPIGLHNPPPEKEEPYFYECGTRPDGKVTVGPFELTADNIKAWSAKANSQKLDDLVSTRQIRPSTAMTVKSNQFEHVVSLIESGQKPSPEMIQRFIPGDLQRVIARDVQRK